MEKQKKLLQLLQSKKSQYISGVWLAQQLHVSRTTIWKHIQKLKQQGYLIENKHQKGYCYFGETEQLHQKLLQQLIQKKDFPIFIFETLPSTNEYAKSLAQTQKKDALIIANEQTAGKGKQGKKFYSPKKTGIYFSLLIHPEKINTQDASLITAATAVAIYEAFLELYQIKLAIKWVNDLFYHDKKVGGILAEAHIDFENGYVEYLIIGIGLNLVTDSFPNDLTPIAGSIFQPNTQFQCNHIIAKITKNIYDQLQSFKEKKFISLYQENAYLLNKKIEVTMNQQTFDALVLAVDTNCRLVVQPLNSKKILHLHSADIKIKEC